MSTGEALRIAVHALRANRLRSALTTLGIIIGVSAVIVLVGLGDGLQTGFEKSFGELGTVVLVNKVEGDVPGAGASRDLTDADVRALSSAEAAPAIASVTPVVTGTGMMAADQARFRASITGTTSHYLSVNSRELVAGSMFTEAQERANAKVVVLGPNPVASLFGGDANRAVGQTVRIGRTAFRVIGVVKGDGQSDDIAIMPLDTARSYLIGGDNTVSQLVVKATALDTVPSAVEQVTAVLSDQHNISDPEQRDFEVTALGTLLDQFDQILVYLTLFTVAVAGISLVVGAIGVANIMLVSVTERTREIGIRKAIGAPRGAIVSQFLIESMVLAGLGGLAGIGIGIGITLAGAAVIPSVAPDFGAPEVNYLAIAVAFGVSLVIGVVAGGYPAYRAARMRPVQALRYE